MATTSKRPLTPYTSFVQQTYHTPEIMALPVRDRFKELGRRWQAMKNAPAKKAGKKTTAKPAAKKPAKTKKKTPAKAPKKAKAAKVKCARECK